MFRERFVELLLVARRCGCGGRRKRRVARVYGARGWKGIGDGIYEDLMVSEDPRSSGLRLGCRYSIPLRVFPL